MAVAVVQHVPYEGPGLIRQALLGQGLTVVVVRSYAGDSLPDADRIDGLVVLGGPMSLTESGRFPFLKAERRLIRTCVARGVPVLGVCLGAQLLASALGADVRADGLVEVGVGEVFLTDAGVRDPLLAHPDGRLPVFHRHQDTFTLPVGAQLLAVSSVYRNQAFRFGSAYGFQFHLELDAATVGAMTPHLPAGVTVLHEDG